MNTPNTLQRFASHRFAIIAVVLGLIVLATGFFAGYILVRGQSPSESSSQLNLKEHAFDGLTLRTNVDTNIASEVAKFIQRAVRKNLVPTDLTFQFADRGNGDRGDAYVTAWEKNGMFISLLFGLTRDNKKLNYMRIWIMPPGTSATQKEAEVLLADVYDETFLTEIGTIACRPATDPQTASPTTECSKLATNQNGDLEGVTVKAPFILQSPPGGPVSSSSAKTVIIASSCHIPKEGAPIYTASSCL